MDEAFIPFSELIPQILPVTDPVEDLTLGVRTMVTACVVETPIELDIMWGTHGLAVGSVPPLYHLETSDLPVFHRVRITVESHHANSPPLPAEEVRDE